MKRFLNILITVLLIILQVTVLSRIKIFGITVNLALAGIIIVACIADNVTAVLNAVISGVIFDVFAGYNVGCYLFAFVIIVALILLIIKFMYKGSLFTTLSMTAIFTILLEVALYYIFYLRNGEIYSSAILIKIIIPQTILNVIASLVLFGAYKKINKRNTKNLY